MEDAMLRIRIVTMGALLLLMIGSAAAQDAGAAKAAPGKPMSLLHSHLAKQKAKPHVRLAHAQKLRSRTERRLVPRSLPLAASHEDPAPAVPTIPPPNAWPALNGDLSAANSATQSSAAPENVGAMVVDGHTVQIASPDEVNSIDLAADEPHEVAAMPDDRADRDPAAPSIAFAQQDDSGTQSWISELFATLGGALAAGSVGWFLFGAPQRRYG